MLRQKPIVVEWNLEVCEIAGINVLELIWLAARKS